MKHYHVETIEPKMGSSNVFSARNSTAVSVAAQLSEQYMEADSTEPFPARDGGDHAPAEVKSTSISSVAQAAEALAASEPPTHVEIADPAPCSSNPAGPGNTEVLPEESVGASQLLA